MATFSVIVPVYNVEEYLEACLDSLKAALSEEDELVLSVRAGEDRSAGIAEEYARRYANVRLFEQSGRGLADARNLGLRAARGEYVLFADGDDRVLSESLSELLGRIRSGEYAADVIMTDYYSESGGTLRRMSQIGERVLRGRDALAQIAHRTSAFWTVWRNVYRRSFLEEHGLYFCDTVFNEDADFTARVLTAQPDMLFVGEAYYCYRRDREGSLSGGAALARMEQNEAIFRASITRLRGGAGAWAKTAVCCYQYGYVMNIALLRELPRERQEEGAALLRGWKSALLPAADCWIGGVALLMDLVGPSAVSDALGVFKRIRRKREGR